MCIWTPCMTMLGLPGVMAASFLWKQAGRNRGAWWGKAERKDGRNRRTKGGKEGRKGRKWRKEGNNRKDGKEGHKARAQGQQEMDEWAEHTHTWKKAVMDGEAAMLRAAFLLFLELAKYTHRAPPCPFVWAFECYLSYVDQTSCLPLCWPHCTLTNTH